ncbi:unnamed protein product, partial [Brenthis ino]
MNLLVVKLLFLLLVAFATGKSIRDEDPPALKWQKKYTLDATKLHLSSGLIEDVKYWRSGRKSRVDYNHGAVKSISIAGKRKSLQFGVKYTIFPVTTEEYDNKIICSYVNGTIGHIIQVEDILPSSWSFEDGFVGKDILETGEVYKFASTDKDDYENTEERTYVWAMLDKDNKSWIPVKIEEMKFNTWVGSAKDHYIWNIINYEADFEDSVFDVDQYNCTESEQSEDNNLKTHIDSENHVDREFKRFVAEHGRQYNDQTEHEMRKNIFAENLRRVQDHNRKNTSFKLGINKFSDRTPEEMKKMKGLRRRKEGQIGTVPFPYSKTEIADISKDLPKEFDLRMLGVITPVKDQDMCGSCWTFGTTSAVEGALARQNGGRLLRLANQALIDCAWGFHAAGCDGGSDTAAYHWMMKYGLPTEEEYGPYSNKDGFCRIKNMTQLYPIKGFTDVTPFSVEALKVALINHGPLSVSIDATTALTLYSSGIMFDSECDKTVLNHEVTLVGYGVRDDEEYWIVKNSWGRTWGIDGYFHISTRNTDCGITTEPTYVVL